MQPQEKENIHPLPKLEGEPWTHSEVPASFSFKSSATLFQKVKNFPIWAACCYGNLPKTPVL